MPTQTKSDMGIAGEHVNAGTSPREARVIDIDGVYDPCRPNDRLLIGMKGSISEFELGVLRARMVDAARAKAQRGELRIAVPVGSIWHRDIGLGFGPVQ
jgi:DNA invertase Pin-like site-specific DNA recombinase